MNVQAPKIQSVGPPPNRHAERIVDEMLVWMHGQQREIWNRSKRSLHRRQMGNPTGQERAIARFREAIGDMALDIRLRTGKRGRFRLAMAAWVVWNSRKEDMAHPHDPPPDNSALAVAFSTCGRDHQWNSGVPLIVTRHAMVRMAERAGMRTVSDLVSAMGSVWRAYYNIIAREVDALIDEQPEILRGEPTKGGSRFQSPPLEDRLPRPPPEGWRIKLDNGAVIVVGRDAEGSRRLIVKTVLDHNTPATVL